MGSKQFHIFWYSKGPKMTKGIVFFAIVWTPVMTAKYCSGDLTRLPEKVNSRSAGAVYISIWRIDNVEDAQQAFR